ncbi:MAG: hypothetical protein GY715_20070 [Planctomycetes bacterium]|nr:hypothetical protein [Planctomycetota bacterium]
MRCQLSSRIATILTVITLLVLVLPTDAPGQQMISDDRMQPRFPILGTPYIIASSREDGEMARDYTVTLCEDDNHGGEWLTIRVWLDESINEYKVDIDYAGFFWNNRISSIGPEGGDYPANWTLYDNSGCDGYLESGSGEKDQVDHNDMASSARARVPDNRDWCWFYIYEHKNQGGKCLPFKLYKHGNSSNYVLEITGLDDHWNDYVSSIDTDTQGGSNFSWKFYKNSNFSGTNLTLSGGADDEDLDDNGLENAITSIRLIVND